VVQYEWPLPAPGSAPPVDDEPSAAARDAMLDAQRAPGPNSSLPPGAVGVGLGATALGDSLGTAADSAAVDSTTVKAPATPPPPQGFRDRNIDPSTAD
jgi:hypothetical protein